MSIAMSSASDVWWISWIFVDGLQCPKSNLLLEHCTCSSFSPLLPNSNAHNSRSSLDDSFKLQTYCTVRFLIPAWKCLFVRCRQAAVARIWWDLYVLLGCGRWHGQGLLLHQTKVQSNPRYFLVLEFLHQGIKTHQGTHRTPRINTKDHKRTQLAV